MHRRDPHDSAPHLSAAAATSAPSAPHNAAEVAPAERYTDLGPIGSGGMGEVRAVFDGKLGRQVARKSPRVGVAGAAALLAREAALTASLEHPGIVPVYDAGVGPEGAPWYTMRLVRGRSLRQVLAETPELLDRLALLRLLLSAVEAVAYAHARGVVHCDLKTTNLMLGEHGEVQVVDWGLAASGPAGPGGGTPLTMAPEQQRGEAPTPATDVWAIGLILMELLTGAPLEGPATREQVAALALNGVPLALRALLLRCVEPEPQRRYPDAAAVAADLARYLDGRPVEAHDYTLSEHLRRLLARHRLAATVAAVAGVLLLGVSAWATQRVVEGRDQARAAEGVAQEARARSDATLARALVFAARTAAAGQQRAEAEVLAAHALTLAESPEARGVLAGFDATPRPGRVAAAAEACTGIRRIGPPGVLCLQRGAVSASLRSGARWTRTIEAADVAFAGDDVILTLPDNRALWLDGRTGDERGQIPALPAAHGLLSGPSAAWLVAGRQLVRIQQDVATVFLPCGEDGVAAATETRQGGLVLVCGPQGLRRWAPDRADSEAIALGLRDPQATIRQLAAGPDGAVAVGTDRGDVVVVDGDGTRFRAEVATAISDLKWTEDGERLLVSQRMGPPVVLDGRSGAELGRLPTDAGEWVGSSGPSGLLLDGGGGNRWSLAELRPPVLGAGAGITGVLPGLDGAVLVTRGDGRIDRIDPTDGTVLLLQSASTRPLKGITRLPAGDGYAVVGVEGGLRRISADLTRDQLLAPVPGRRVLTLGQRLLVLRYRGPGSLHAPDPGMADGDPLVLQGGDAAWFDAGADETERFAAALDDLGQLWRVAADGNTTALGRFPDASAVDAMADGGAILGEAAALVRVGPGGAVSRLPWAHGRPVDLAISPDERWVALGGRDGVIRVFDLKAGGVTAVLEGHREQVSSLAWASPTRLLSGSWDGTVRQWELGGLEQPAAAWLAVVDAAWGLSLGQALAAARP